MATAYETLYAAASAIMADVNTAATQTVLSLAPTNYGTDFRITPGAGVYQIQLAPVHPYPGNSNLNYPRAVVTVLVHHYVLANEDAFTLDTMYQVVEYLSSHSVWQAEAGVYDLQPDEEPDVAEGEREGNVITFSVSVAVLMDPV